MKRGVRPPRGLDLAPERISVPSPRVVGELIDEVAHTAISVQDNFLWLHGVAHSVQVLENAKIRSTSPSNSTYTAATRSKGALLASYERVLDAHGKLREAEALLLKALNRYDPPQTPVAWSRVTVRKIELEAYQEAALRRKERGEHIP